MDENKNTLIQQKKIEGIKVALNHLHEMGVKNLMNKKLISETTKQLFPYDQDYQVSRVTLSNDYYKQQLPKLVKDFSNHYNPNSHKNLKTARQIKNKNFRKKMKELQRFCKELAIKIKSGEVKTEKEIPPKSFLTNEIKQHLGYSVNLSMKHYSFLYPNFFLEELLSEEFYDEENKNQTKFVEISKYKKLHREKQIAEIEFNNLVSKQFRNYYLKQENNLFAKGDGFIELHNMDIDLNLLFGFIEKELKYVYSNQKSVNAFKLVQTLLENCSVK